MPRMHNPIFFQKSPASEPTFQANSPLFCPSYHDSVHAVFVPKHYEPGYAYPLIVWLHGPGSDERQLRSIMPKVSIQNYLAVAPRGLCVKGVLDGEKEGYGWPQNEEQLAEVEQSIFDAIEVASQKFSVSKKRIFLAGFDAGGTMAFRMALSHPQYFGGIVSLGGAIPRCQRLLGSLPLARKLPIFLAVGRKSHEYSENVVCENLRLLHTAGMSITLRQYPCGHELSDQMLADVDRWIIEQITASTAELKSFDM